MEITFFFNHSFDSSFIESVSIVSIGAGGGVVNMVQPIQIAIPKTAKTKMKTGIATAHQPNQAGHAGKIAEIEFAKNAAK